MIILFVKKDLRSVVRTNINPLVILILNFMSVFMLLAVLSFFENEDNLKSLFWAVGLTFWFNNILSFWLFYSMKKTLWFTGEGYEHLFYDKFKLNYTKIYIAKCLVNGFFLLAIPLVQLIGSIVTIKILGLEEMAYKFILIWSMNLLLIIYLICSTLYKDFKYNNISGRKSHWIGRPEYNLPWLVVASLVGFQSDFIEAISLNNKYISFLIFAVVLLTISVVSYFTFKISKIKSIIYNEVDYE